MLAFYRQKYPEEVGTFPLLPGEGLHLAKSTTSTLSMSSPSRKGVQRKEIIATVEGHSLFITGNKYIRLTGSSNTFRTALWDGGAWGTYLSGLYDEDARPKDSEVSRSQGKKDKKDRVGGTMAMFSHIVAHGIHHSNCVVRQQCVSGKNTPMIVAQNLVNRNFGGSNSTEDVCYTAPYVRCCNGGPGTESKSGCGIWRPLWNLAVIPGGGSSRGLSSMDQLQPDLAKTLERNMRHLRTHSCSCSQATEPTSLLSATVSQSGTDSAASLHVAADPALPEASATTGSDLKVSAPLSQEILDQQPSLREQQDKLENANEDEKKMLTDSVENSAAAKAEVEAKNASGEEVDPSDMTAYLFLTGPHSALPANQHAGQQSLPVAGPPPGEVADKDVLSLFD